MTRIWGFDIGTTSIGWAVIDHDPDKGTGSVALGRNNAHGMGVRIFPEARDPDGTPLNQTRRQKRMMRRQLRRRRERRKALNLALAEAGLLPSFSSHGWARVMAADPWELRAKGLSETLTPEEFGRALYHLAKHRHFRGRDLEEVEAAADTKADADEKAAADARKSFLVELDKSGSTIGALLASRDPHVRKRGVHASREAVVNEFERLWHAQAAYNPALSDTLKDHVGGIIFAQRPVFWRKATLGACQLMPGEDLCPKGAWLSQQRRMLEKLNNLEIASGNRRPLDEDERAAVLAKLQTQGGMSWAGVRKALAPLFAARGEQGQEQRIKFNLELGGDAKLLGNPLEAKLAEIFGSEWHNHPHKQAIRDATHARLWAADYGEVGKQRIVIQRERERRVRRDQAAKSFVTDFSASPEQAEQLGAIKFPQGWEPFSYRALAAILPELEKGVKFGTLTVSPDHAGWRAATFPNRDQPTGEILDRLPSPSHRPVNGKENHAGKEEQRRLTNLRNPTVIRTQNELRKVVNNLIDAFGKPDLIRIELARDIGLSKREREEKQKGMRANAKKRDEAKKDLKSKGIMEPSGADITKWVLWKEGNGRCPYTRDEIGFDALFRRGEYEVEHIWPRSRSLDDSQGNKTLCRKDINLAKGNRTPFEYFQNDPVGWKNVRDWMDANTSSRGGPGFPRGKVKRFLAETMPDDFAARQLNDTGYSARQAIALLKRLWPDVGPEAPVNVQAVTGKVTAQLRKYWGLNHILSDDGEKTRADHRHHAVDALVVACTDPGITNRLSRYLQAKDFEQRPERPTLPLPWPTIRADAAAAVERIVVSHRVRKKVSGPLHKETVYGDTATDIIRSRVTYRQVVTRKPLASLTPKELNAIRDPLVRENVNDWVARHGGDPKKAFGTFPPHSPGGTEIRKARIIVEQQATLMAPISTGFASLGNNHHLAIYQLEDGKLDWRIVSMFEASRRLARREPIVTKMLPEGGTLAMSIALGDTVQIAQGDKAGLWVANILSANGQIFFRRAEDASPAGDTKWGPNANTLFREQARKIAVDPIGRIRPAND